MIDTSDQPHRRYNPLLDEWVLVSPHRTKRPWLGQKDEPSKELKPPHDPTCYLCPGNVRATGDVNPEYAGTFAFENDFAALLMKSEEATSYNNGLLHSSPVGGECRVLCFSPRHDLTLGDMSIPDIRGVVDMWAEQILDVGSRLKWVQIFENKGAAMGASNPHPHGQVWACDYLPTLIAREGECQRKYADSTGRPMLIDLVDQELAAEDRIVVDSRHWLLIVPYWATWPFETMLLPKRAVRRMPELTSEERDDLAYVLKTGIQAYDRLFDTSFPYSMGCHGAPTDGRDHPEWQLHAHFYPPLLRSASVRKFMVGFELLAEAQRDLTAEGAAKRLRDCVQEPV